MNEIFNDYPELEKLYNMRLEIDEIDRKIENEKNFETVIDLFESRRELEKTHSIETSKVFMGYLEKQSKRIDDLGNKSIELSKMFTDERTRTNEMLESIVMAMMVNPVDGFQLLLNYVDRNNKIEDQDGQSWMYSLKFTYKERLLMAYRLIKPVSRKI